ncbi:MAG: hypothetical protein IPP40_13325 [bacterium]|nr:hypothetical protein [bacterium]
MFPTWKIHTRSLALSVKRLCVPAFRNQHIFVAAADAGIVVLDVSNPVAPQIANSDSTSTRPVQLEIRDDYAYVVDYSEGLRIYAILNETELEQVGFVELPGLTFSVTLADSLAFVAQQFGMYIIDISDPTAPLQIGSLTELRHFFNIAVSGGYAYSANNTEGFHVIDISNPQEPFIVGSNTDLYWARAVAVSNDFAFVAAYNQGLKVFDVSIQQTQWKFSHLKTYTGHPT